MEKKKKEFNPCFLATGVGTLPHGSVEEACSLIARTLPHTPFWPQLPQYSVLEGMIAQVSPGLPFLKVDEGRGAVLFDGSRDEALEMEKLYRLYLEGDIHAYSLPSPFARGFEGMVHQLTKAGNTPLKFFKGQIAGPITFGLTVQDNTGRSVIHNEVVFDALMKGLLLRGRWLIQKMKAVCEDVILFIDEPALAGYGSAFFNVDASTILKRLNEMIEDFQDQDVRVGIHCCGNMDWALLLGTKADIINFDAWGFFDRFSLYPDALNAFLARQGVLAWGIVPTLEFTGEETVEALEEKLEGGIHELSGKGISEELLRKRCLLTPSCGMGLLSVKDSERILDLLAGLSRRMRNKYF